MKKALSLILAVVMAAMTLVLSGCGKFDYTKEDLSEYIDLKGFNGYTYAEMEKSFKELRLSEASTVVGKQFAPDWGYTVDFSLTAEYSDGDDKVSVDEWCREVKDYDIFRNEDNLLFDYGIVYDENDVGDVNAVGSNVRDIVIGTPFTFSMTVPADFDGNKELAGKSVLFTVNVSRVVPAVYSDGYIADRITSFFEKVGYEKDAIEEYDYVKVDITEGKLDGVEYNFTWPDDNGEGPEMTAFSFAAGHSGLWEGFDAQLMGAGVGDTVEISIAFPADYENSDTNLAGKTATFSVKVSMVYNYTWTIQKNTDFETLWDMKQALRVMSYAEMYAIDMVVHDSEVKAYPKSLYAQYKKMYEDEVNATVDNEYASYRNLGYTNITREDVENEMYPDGIDKYVSENTDATVKAALVTYSLIEKYGIVYTDKDYEDFINSIIMTLEQTEGASYSRKQIEERYSKDYLIMQLYQGLLNTRIYEEAEGIPVIPQSEETDGTEGE